MFLNNLSVFFSFVCPIFRAVFLCFWCAEWKCVGRGPPDLHRDYEKHIKWHEFLPMFDPFFVFFFVVLWLILADFSGIFVSFFVVFFCVFLLFFDLRDCFGGVFFACFSLIFIDFYVLFWRRFAVREGGNGRDRAPKGIRWRACVLGESWILWPHSVCRTLHGSAQSHEAMLDKTFQQHKHR